MREPARQCVACRISTAKRDLIRLVRTPSGEVVIDVKKRFEGRGAYICPSEACIDLAKKKHSIDRALKCHASDDIYDSLKGMVHEQT